MKTFQQQPDELADLRRRLALCDQEREQLQTALEDAEQRIEVLEDGKSGLRAENAHLRHLLAECHGRFVEARVEPGRSTSRQETGLEGELTVLSEELQVSVEELQVTAEELEEANAGLRTANETLEQQVAERTASLSTALEERNALLRHKDLLIREVDHRVKNSLQMVLSLLRLQSSRVTDPMTRRVLQTTDVRIQAIAQVHAMLYARSEVESQTSGEDQYDGLGHRRFKHDSLT